ncbi:MAG: O-antigen ligase family protein [Chloroflexi bacterium]|nr:MAG: O-antigen ligase family protein [Chloroflexota bacterium]
MRWAILVTLAVIGVVSVLLFKDLKKIFLVVFVIDIPLGLDVSIGPLYSDHQGGPVSMVISLSTLILPVAYGLWLLEKREKGHRKIEYFKPIAIFAVLYLLITVISSAWAKDITLSYFEIFLNLQFVLYFFYIANQIRGWDDVKVLLGALIVGFLLESILVILQANTNIDLSFLKLNAASYVDTDIKGWGVRAGGTFGGPNAVGAYLASAMVLTMGGYLLGKRLGLHLLALSTLPLGAVALFSTGSRGAWTSMSIGMGVLFASALVRRLSVTKVVVILLIGGIAILPILPRIEARLTGDDAGSAESRIIYNQLAWNIIDRNFWTGVGANNFDVVKWDYLPPRLKTELRSYVYVVHNKYLLVWSQTGFFGFLAYIATLIATVLVVARGLTRRSDPRLYLLAASLIGALLGYAFHMNVDIFDSRQEQQQLWLMMALSAGITQLHKLPFTGQTEAETQ